MNEAKTPSSALGAWVMATRPPTLAAAAVPVCVGSAVAYSEGGFRWHAALAAMVGAVLIQIGTNFANDVFDFEKGADTETRLGPTRAVAAGLLSPAAVRRAMWLTFALAALVGVYLAAVSSPWIMLVGLVSIASGIAYTGGPYPLGYNGLGDVFVFVFFGFVAVAGTVFVQTLTIPTVALVASLPVGALATAILVVNNVRDEPTDKLVGKRTLAVRFGTTFGKLQYGAMVVIAVASPLALFSLGGSAYRLLPLLSVPLGIILLYRVCTRSGAELNPVLVGTAKWLVLYGALLTLGLAIE